MTDRNPHTRRDVEDCWAELAIAVQSARPRLAALLAELPETDPVHHHLKDILEISAREKRAWTQWLEGSTR